MTPKYTGNVVRQAVVVATVATLVAVAPVVGATGSFGGAEAGPDTGAASNLADMAGSGTIEDPYEITNATELQAMNEDPSGHYVLAEDVDASGTRSWNGGQGFEPIGDRETKFTGSFDGQNYTIDGLAIQRTDSYSTALFAFIGDGGTVTDVRLTGVDVRGEDRTGGLVGEVSDRGQVSGSVVSGSVNGNTYVGGLAGFVTEEGRVVESSATADVEGGSNVGGLVGSTKGAILRSSATGTVSGDNPVGGLVGNVDTGASVQNSYATGSVSGNRQIGGLAGYLADARVTSSFATGSVDGERNVGGAIGKSSASASMSDVYWNVETTGADSGIAEKGSSVTETTRLTTDEMTGAAAATNMDGLDTGFAWTSTDEYPVLQWQVDSVSLSTPDQVIVGQPSTVTVSLELSDGRSVPASETAQVTSNETFLTVSQDVIETTDNGTAELAATVGSASGTGTVEVLTPPDISLTDTILPYERVGADVDAPIRAVLENDGGATGEFQVQYAIDGEVVESRTVSVAGYTEATAQFNWSTPGPGEYEVAINGTELGTLTVVEEPETNVVDATLDESTVAESDAATVTATLENVGDAAGSHDVELTVDGETVATKTVIVPADGTTVSFEWAADGSGEYDLAVNGASAGTLTVAEVGTVSIGSVDAPSEIGSGETYELVTSLENSGGVELTTNLTYSVDSETVAERTVTVPAEGTTVTLGHATDAEGTVEHAVTADEDEWSATIDVVASAGTASGAGTDGGAAATNGEDGTTAEDGPGFGVFAALVVLLGAVALRRRHAG